MTADHVAHVQLRHFIVRHVRDAVARLAQLAYDCIVLGAALREPEADENLRRAGIFIAVGELGDVVLTERFAEVQETTGLLRNLHGEQSLAFGTQVGALGDVPQAVEIHVCAAVDRNQPLTAHAGARRILFNACHRQCTGRLDNRTRVLEHILNRRTDLVRIDEHDLIDVLAGERKAFLADAFHGDPIGEYADAFKGDAPSGAQRFVHGGRVFGLDADDFYLRVEALHVYGNAANQAATAYRHEDRVQLSAALPQDLEADSPLPRDHIGVVERMHEHEMALAREHQRPFGRAVVVIAVEHNLAAQMEHRLNLDLRRSLRHDDDRRNRAAARRQRHALRVIAGGCADDAALRDSRGQMSDLVIGAAQLEGENGLQVFALQKHAISDATRQTWGFLERRFAGDVVYACS